MEQYEYLMKYYGYRQIVEASQWERDYDMAQYKLNKSADHDTIEPFKYLFIYFFIAWDRVEP